MAIQFFLQRRGRVSMPRLNWAPILWWSAVHVGAVAAPFTFTWSGLVVCLSLYMIVGLGLTMGYHRLLTHRSFQTPHFVEYILTVLGSLANQGGPLQWVAVHRMHHQHSDQAGDPHSPHHGIWWAHMFWWMPYIPAIDDRARLQRYVPDLARDPVHCFLERWQVVLPLALGVLLFVLGQAWAGVGLSWLVWGIFVRTTLLYHATWLVNSAAHVWGYRTYRTRDRSTNLWWVALLTLGEGWHNNHHAFPRSARHGLRWWEVDFTYLLIRLMSFVALARQIHLPHKILRQARPRPWRMPELRH
jgi:stearoyl-CoA desaturase (delta-9 desaturase)